ncbi:hypothetical protein Tco_0424077 [Tanacetum coccineum]
MQVHWIMWMKKYVTDNANKSYNTLDLKFEFRDTLIHHMESVKKSIDERAHHKREKACGQESKEGKITISRSGKIAHADDADIRPIYDEEPMVEVQTTADINIFATGQQHTEQPEFNNEGKVDQNVEQCHDTCPLPAKLTDNQTTELSNQSLESENIRLKKTVAQFQKDFLRMEAHCVNLELKYQNQALKEGQHGQFLKVTSNEAKAYKEMFDSIKTIRAKNIEHTTSLIANNDKFKAQLQEKGFAIAALKNELRKLTGNSVNTKFAKSSILGKPALQPRRNQSVVRQPTAFKESVVVKPHHVIASSESRNSSKNMPRFSSNDMVHNHYLEEAKKKTQERGRNSRPSVMPSAKSQSTANGSKPKPRSNTQTSRNWPASKNSTLNLSAAMTSDHNSSELEIHDHSNEPSNSKLVPKLVPPADKIATSQQKLDLLFGPLYDEFFNADTRSQDGKDDQDKQGKDLKILELKIKSKDNDKGSRSKITKHEGISLQYDKDQSKVSRSSRKQDSRSHLRNSKTTH